MQRLQRGKPTLCLGLARRLAQLHGTLGSKVAEGAAHLLAGIGAQDRIELAGGGKPVEFDDVRWHRGFAQQQPSAGKRHVRNLA
jgi:hypothetical protein